MTMEERLQRLQAACEASSAMLQIVRRILADEAVAEAIPAHMRETLERELQKTEASVDTALAEASPAREAG